MSQLARHLSTRFLPRAAILSALLLVVTWLYDIQHPARLPLWLLRILVLLSVVLGVAALVQALARAWQNAQADAGRRRAFVILLVLVLIASVAHFAGIDHEAEGRYSGDERTYYGHALQINDGHVWRDSFIYPHLPYYGSAFTLWLIEPFAAPVHGAIRAASGYQSREAMDWIVLHAFTALFGALTVIPVFLMTRRLTRSPIPDADRNTTFSLLAATIAGLLTITSSVYNEVTHLLLCDVPAAFFVTLCLYFVTRLLDQESTRLYLLAGVASGLAAASKYPAGLVALAIIVVWAWHRWRQRNLKLGLVWAGLASLASFLLFNPSLFVYTEAALSGEKSLFFGPRLYARGGWIGIVKESNWSYYSGLIVDNFGWVALTLGVVGLLLALLPVPNRELHREVRREVRRELHREVRPLLRRLALLAPYPVVAFVIMVSVSVAVKRSLLPLLPFLAVVLGCGLAALVWWLRTWLTSRDRAPLVPVLTAVLLGGAILPPAWVTSQQVLAFARQSTREQAVSWITEHVPDGSRILREHYTPRPSRERYRLQMSRFAARLEVETVRRDFDYALFSGNAFNRFLDSSRHTKPHHAVYQRRYERMFAEFEKMAEFTPGPSRYGPHVVIYRIPYGASP